MTKASLVRPALFLALVAAASVAGAQQPMPGSGPQMPAGMPEPADPDTVSARLVLPEDLPAPLSIAFFPDTIAVGSDAFLRLEFLPGQAPADLPALRESSEFSQEWIQWNPKLKAEAVPGNAVVLPVKIYQINPFLVELDGLSTQVVLVDLRTQGSQDTASVRDPRRWGWNFWTLLVGGLLLLGLLLLAWWIWTARKIAAEKLPDWQVPPPSWLQSCLELKSLHDEGILERGQGREYLDRLAGICRRYLAGRFRVGAVEMTGPEIAAACAERGYLRQQAERFTSLLEKIDSSRYDPEGLSNHACLLRGREFMSAMAHVRIIPRHTPVPVDLALAADKAWTQLSEQLLNRELPADDQVFAPDNGKEQV
jgi:hypothetical protein